MRKTFIATIIIASVAASGGFYGGMKYTQGKTAGDFRNFRNFSPEERQQRGRQGGRSGADFANGEIISKDDKSVTVKLGDGGSKIIFISESTEIGKFATGTASDLEIGKTVTVSGKSNSDGSVTADSIQIRPRGIGELIKVTK